MKDTTYEEGEVNGCDPNEETDKFFFIYGVEKSVFHVLLVLINILFELNNYLKLSPPVIIFILINWLRD